MPLPRIILHPLEVSDTTGNALKGKKASNVAIVQASQELKGLSSSLVRITEIAQVAADIFDGLVGLTRDFSARIDLVTERSTLLLSRMNCIPMDHVPSIAKESKPTLFTFMTSATLTKRSSSRLIESTYQDCRIRPQLWKLQQYSGTDPSMFSDPSIFISLWTKSERMKERQRMESNSSQRILDVNLQSERRQSFNKFRSKIAVTVQNVVENDSNEDKDAISRDAFFNRIFNSIARKSPSNGDKWSLENTSLKQHDRGYIKPNAESLEDSENVEYRVDTILSGKDVDSNELCPEEFHNFVSTEVTTSRGNPGKQLKIGNNMFKLGLDVLGKDRSLSISNSHHYDEHVLELLDSNDYSVASCR